MGRSVLQHNPSVCFNEALIMVMHVFKYRCYIVVSQLKNKRVIHVTEACLYHTLLLFLSWVILHHIFLRNMSHNYCALQCKLSCPDVLY